MDKEIKKELQDKERDLLLFCMANKIPMFAVFAEETKRGTVYENTTITPHEVNVTLSDDKITKYSASLNKNFEIRFKSMTKLENNADDAIDDLLSDD